MLLVSATMAHAFAAASCPTSPQDTIMHMAETSVASSECVTSPVYGPATDARIYIDSRPIPHDLDITPATLQDKDFECMSVCRNICWLIWQSATAYCEKSIPPKKRKERERCFRRANEEYAACIKDCERENGRCN